MSDDFDDFFDRVFRAMLRDTWMPDILSRIRHLPASGEQVWGFETRVYPDGRIETRKFGMPPALEGQTAALGTIEPNIDFIDSKDFYMVVIELPGIEEDKITIKVEKRILTVAVSDEKKPYYREMKLPANLEETYDKSYKNGVLELKFKRK